MSTGGWTCLFQLVRLLIGIGTVTMLVAPRGS